MSAQDGVQARTPSTDANARGHGSRRPEERPEHPAVDELQGPPKDRFEKTGPRTPAGRYLRCFWHPVFVSRELAPRRTVPLRILGEELVLYRGATGEPHLLEGRCAHRKALLSIGRVEEDCLRCRYHGWRYDAAGQCVEQPAESRGFAHKVKIRSYPVREHLGLIWAYLGDPPVPAPRWPLVDDGVQFRFATSEYRPFNYFADLENVLDDSHLQFVHGRSVFHDSDIAGQTSTLSAVETEYGLLHETKFANGRTKQYMLLMPNCVRFRSNASRVRGLDGHIWIVPVDDASHVIFFCLTAPKDASTWALMRMVATRSFEAVASRVLGRRSTEEEVQAVISGRKAFEDLPANGMIEDHVVLAAQGASLDRDSHWLGTSDVAIILLRRLWVREITALSEGRPLTPFVIPHGLRPT